ncbi:MAG: glycosyltransferase [Bacteroidota bacterium]
MEYYIYISIFLSLAYVLIILRYLEGWKALPDWEIPFDFSPSTKVSILIPARNEAANIQRCMQSILSQNYPIHLFEIILIDDHSEDDTVTLVKKMNAKNIQILYLKDYVADRSSLTAFKKKALEIGIKKSIGELIVTTDADCVVPKNWLGYLVSFYEKKAVKFIAAPVNFYEEHSLFERFQSLDFMGMMCITGAGIHRRFMNMCNGANLAYEKKAFYAINGFEGINQIASGDDMLLMQKMSKQFPNQIGFLKNKKATVLTRAVPDLKSFVAQRIRWGSKSGNYQEFQIIIILGFVFLFCVNILLNFLLLPFFFSTLIWIFFFQLFTKTIIDYFFLKSMSDFFERKDLMNVFFPSQILHIIYIAVIGFLSNLKKEYHWKGRKVR